MSESEVYEMEKDVRGSVFIQSEDVQKPEKKDYSKVYVLPTIKTRYISMLIDIVIIVLISLAISSVFEMIGKIPALVKAIFFVVVVLLYEPILISSGTTVGQFLLNLRVRNFKNPDQKLTFHLAVVRTIVKILLGWLSFVTVTFNVNRRAIHDFASGSIMISQRIK